jgi:D-Tyr-tRNAtyr deacylase
MRVVIQRVSSSRVVVDGEVVGSIGRGLNLLVETGKFGASMQVAIENDGLVTLLLEKSD